MTRTQDALNLINAMGVEQVTYKPAGGGSRTIMAVVLRDQPGPLGDAPHGRAPTLVVFVANDAADGIASTELDMGGGDCIELERRIGDSPGDRRITKMLKQDSGVLQLELR